MPVLQPVAPPAQPLSAPGRPSVAARGLAAAAPRQGHPAAQRDWTRGVALVRQGALADAARLFERACRQSPRVSLYWLNLASTQHKLGREDAALASAREAAAADPACVPSAQLLAELLRQQHRPAEALAALDALRAAGPLPAQHALLRGALLSALDRPAEAAAAFLQVLAQQPRDTQAHLQLGFALVALRRFGEAAACFRAVTQIDPAQLGAAIHAAHHAAWVCDWQRQPQDLQRLQQALQAWAEGRRPTDAAAAAGFSPFGLLALADDPALHRLCARIEADRLAQDIRRRSGWRPTGSGLEAYPQAARALAEGRCRVGLVSNDFRTHATSLLLVQALERLDRGRFELVLYSHGPDDGSALRRRVEAAADRFVDCRGMTLEAQARRIREDGIVVLVELNGFTRQSRLPVLALRPAPVQASWLGYPGTLGAGWVDYLIGDPVVTPMAHAGDFEEHLVQLPGGYQPNDGDREHPETRCSRSDLGLPEDGFVFACFNQSYKITEDMFARWCRILQRVPGSVLWLLVPEEPVQATLRLAAGRLGLAPERLVFADFLPQTEHLARLPLADVALDTFPCGAHTTASDALWMGVPLLTLMGRGFASRVAGSLLHGVGLSVLAVEQADDYEDLAVRLAEDREALTDLRDHLWDNRRDLPLFDADRFAAEWGDALAAMAGRWQQGLPPAAMPA